MFDELILEKNDLDIEEPKDYKLMLWNDDTTLIDTVVKVLTDIIGFDTQKAVNVTIKAHNFGNCCVGMYPYEIAETLMVESMKYVHSRGYHDFKMTVEEA